MTSPHLTHFGSVRDPLRSLKSGLVLFAVGLVACIAFAENWFLPVQLSAALVAAIVLVGMKRLAVTRLSLLSRFMLLLYLLPFTSLIVVTVLRDLNWWETPAAVELIVDSRITDVMLATGVVGALGLVAGMWLGVWPARHTGMGQREARTLTLNMFFSMLGVALAIAILSAGSRRDAYFSDALEAATSGGATGSLYVVSYVLIALLSIDLLDDTRRDRRRWKSIALIVVCGYIVVVLQLLRGDRESLGLIVALAGLYITQVEPGGGPSDGRHEWKRVRRLLPVIVVALVAFLAIGQLRYRDAAAVAGVSGSVTAAASREVAQGGTWTAVLLGNLGLANEYTNGQMQYLRGQTYIDYVTSLPPRLITQSLGIERAIEGATSPGLWYYPLQWGGVSPVVVPFRNFGIWGVLVVMTLVGWFIARREYWNGSGTLWSRLLYGTLFLSSFGWFWYGDMMLIRGLMAAALVGAVYLLLPTQGSHRTMDVSPPSSTGSTPSTSTV